MKKLILTTLLLSPTLALASGGGNAIDGLFTADMAYKTANFLVLLLLLHIFVKRPLTSALRSAAIATKDEFEFTQRQVEDKEAELAKLKAEFEQMITDLETKKTETLAAIAEEKKKILADTHAQAKLIEESAVRRAAQATAKATNDIKNVLVEEATKLAATGVKNKIDKSQKKALLETYEKSLDEAG